MSPADYVNVIVIPTLREALEARGDRRRMYLACIAVFHVIDYIAVSRSVKFDALRQIVRSNCGVDFILMQGVSNGSKHAGGEKGQWIAPGSERDVRPFGFGPDCAGFGEGRWDYPGLAVIHDGKEYYLDQVVQVFLIKLQTMFRSELEGIDLSFIDPGITYFYPISDGDTVGLIIPPGNEALPS